MGMLDFYEPVPELKCPICSSIIAEWQSKEGPNCLYVWQQNCISPVDQRCVEECRTPRSQVAQKRLPERFNISGECACGHSTEAECITENGIWVSTTLITLENDSQRPWETRAVYKSRLRQYRVKSTQK